MNTNKIIKSVLSGIFLITLSNCVTIPNSSLNESINNNVITIDNVSDKNKDFKINFQELVGGNDFGIELEYTSEKNESQIITIHYKTNENSVILLTLLNNQSYSPETQDSTKNTLNFISNKELKDKILLNLNKLNSQDNDKTELLNIMIKLIEGKELKLEKQIIQLVPDKKFIKFEKINEKNFKLSVLEDGYYLELLDKSNNKTLYSKSNNFIITDRGTIVTLEKGYTLIPEISLMSNQILNEITEYGEINVSFNYNIKKNILLSLLSLSYFNKFSKLEEKDSYFLETNESGKPEIKIIRNMLIKYKLVEK